MSADLFSDYQQDHFTLFGLSRRFSLDIPQLDTLWRAAAAQVHPDRFASASDAEKRVALMAATRVNEAYQTLKSPLSRARYLLSLHGVDTAEETNTSMPVAFLMTQMEWRESIEDARRAGDIEALEKLSRSLRNDVHEQEAVLGNAIDEAQDFDSAALMVRKLRFLEKLDQEISDAIEALLF